ncbi:hypothetical protein [Pseudobacteriovorax antillogorgiicola]|uniref:Uncharacterized protein n=1 Tax=Pseudobacteriovorax antillogorgiicola TaxID=1513793 RepID=A0A1Y6BBS7_9BACT|nr:hypothetical protein [Pseudobacteriovorax antillogorgiicola]TCS58730.1 hypothetical protein EDD56_102244 [Pseudobacteriovorax antillogorgiicola]SME95319.1 hypothetical protein SAMN06296036_102199 [Pseudobacteriovorax antillogorgiicola]
MRSIQFYRDKLDKSETLAEVEKFLSGGLKQLSQDKQNMLDKKTRLNDQIKQLESELNGFKTYEKALTQLGQKKMGEIFARLSNKA